MFEEDGVLIYYKNDAPKHAGVVKIGKDIYYISSGGRAVKGDHIVHRDMANGILKRGTYTFGEDYKLIKGTYVPPKKKKKQPKLNFHWRKRDLRKSIRKAYKRMEHKKLIAWLLAGILVLTAVAVLAEMGIIRSPLAQEQGSQKYSEPTIVVPGFTGDVLLCSKAAKQVYDGTLSLTAAAEGGDPYRGVQFKYELYHCSGTLYLSETEDFSNARTYELQEEDRSVTLHNLKVNTTYYYKVEAADKTVTGMFHTAPSTRFAYIPGLKNLRDIGGYQTLDGKTVKQGLLIRGVELDGLVNGDYFISAEVAKEVQKDFGFAYEMDLRGTGIYSGTYQSRLGVPHKFYAAPLHGEIFKEVRQECIRQVFSDLADPAKYPIYMHCTLGEGTTGSMVFLLQGVLNVSQEDMRQEYMLSRYADQSLNNSNDVDVMIAGLESYAGDTLQEKIVTFLTTEVGVTEEEIASIRSIFLED